MSCGASLPVGCQYDRSVVADSMSRWGLLAVEDGMQKALAWLARHDASYLATGFLIFQYGWPERCATFVFDWREHAYVQCSIH